MTNLKMITSAHLDVACYLRAFGLIQTLSDQIRPSEGLVPSVLA